MNKNKHLHFAPCAFLAIASFGCGEEEPEIASRLNESKKCWEAPTSTGIYRQWEGCNNAITYFIDENGQIWRFASNCGYQWPKIQSNHPLASELPSYPECETQGQMP